MISDVAEAGYADAHRTRQQRNQVRADLQSGLIYLHAPIRELVEERFSPAPLLQCLHGAFQPLRTEGENVLRAVIEGSEGQREILAVKPVRLLVAKERALLQSSQIGPEHDCVITTSKVRARNTKSHQRTESRSSTGITYLS